MRVSPLRCWALLAATAAAGALAQAVPPPTTPTNAVPLPAAKPGAIRPPGTAPKGAAVPGKLPSGTAVPGKLPDGAPVPETLPDGTPLPDKLPPPPERPPGWLPRTTPQEGPELNAVPPPLAEGGEMRREPRELETTPTLDAVGTSVKVVSGAQKAAKWADSVSGEYYKGPLGTFGKVLKAADVAIQLGGGYYRDEGHGVAAATDALWEAAKTSAIIDVSAGVAAGLAGHAAAPVAAAAAAGYALGSGIDSVAGDMIFRNGLGALHDWGDGVYDRVVREPQREEMGRQLREKHQRTKAENAIRATVAAQRAAAAPQTQVRTPAIAESSGPSAFQLLLQSAIQVQKARIDAKAAAQGGGASPQEEPRKPCSPVCTVQ